MNSQILKSITLRHIDEDYFNTILNNMRSFLDQEILHWIPSMIIGTDAPVLNSIFFVSKDFITEFRLKGNREDVDYDVIRFNTIVNIRTTSLLRQIKNNEIVVGTICSAEISLLHTYSGFATSISYVGNKHDREQWLIATNKIFNPKSLFIGKA